MQHITRWPFVQVGFYLALFSVLALALGGHLPDSQAGWITCPPRRPPGAAPDTRRRRRATLVPGDWAARGRACWDYLRHSWRVMVLRSALLAGLWWASGRQGLWAVGLVPLLVTLSRTVQAGWPELATWAPWRLGATALWHGHRLLLGGYLLLALWEAGRASGLPVGLGLGCLHCDREEPWVGVTRQEDGRYRAEFCGHFELTLADRDPFRERLLLLFLRQLEVPGATRGSRRTRDGRTPFVRQMQLQAWFGIVHPVISRLERDWLRVERLLFGRWEEVTDDTVRCPQCRSEDIGRKSRRPRLKKYWDAQQQLQEVAVYRYYCHNPACAVKTFTHLPPGLVPYSRYRLEVHTLALQAYAWGYSVYRRVGPALGVRAVTVYRWVSAWGHNLLPVAALFGLVRCSGVVGVDEKYVLVPKNDKPAGKMRRWMYVYLAVDVYTYDLLHIALYPHNNQGSAHAFLLAFRAKGYHPRVVVTDLRRDYGAVIAQVFARARHHECIFHAEQGIRDYFRETWGRNYAATHPEAVALQETVQEILRARTKRTAQKRYAALCACRRAVVRASPPLEWVFEFLAQHWPRLVNAVESDLVPRTNNAVELVIRRFDQHYQNFCGFESLATAQVYLGVFEKVYRFTPFSEDAQPAIRGKCPLELAGYDLHQMPMPWLCRGYSLEWPIVQEVPDAVVPNL